MVIDPKVLGRQTRKETVQLGMMEIWISGKKGIEQ